MQNLGHENQLILRAEYEVNGNKITLSPGIIKKFLVAGGGNVTDEEVGMFIQICKAQKLNPFLREAYLIKYGNQSATIITGKDTFTKRAERNKNFKGSEAGIIVINLKNQLERRVGSFYMKKREELVGGWAKVYRKDREIPLEIEVSLEEYIGRKKDGTANQQWATKAATMIRKVALVQALREAFPEDFTGLYSAEEMDIDENDLEDGIVNIKATNRVEDIPSMADKKQKAYIMQIAQNKGLIEGNNIDGLLSFTEKNGMNLRSLTCQEAEQLSELLEKYEVIVEADYISENEKVEKSANDEDETFEEIEN